MVRLRPRSNWGVALDVNKKHEVVVYQCHGKANQLFEVSSVAGGYSITGRNGGH
jgi:hypothetical protein